MSHENVNIVMKVFRAFRERDEETIFGLYASDIEWDLGGYTPWTDQRLYRGHDGVRAFFRQWLADFDDYQTEASDPLDHGERVVVTVVDRARGKRSGVSIERVHAQIWTFRDGMVARIEIRDSREDAVNALWLER
jgi:ketosteroid isomerase-like protein